MSLLDLLKKIIRKTPDQQRSPESKADLVDLGRISVISPLSKEVEIDVEMEAKVYCTVDAIIVQPDALSFSGKHTVTLIIDPSQLEPGALIEGCLVFEMSGQKKVIRITGEVDQTGFEDISSTSVISRQPWGLVKTFAGDGSRIWSLTFIGSGKKFASGSENGSIIWWSLNDEKPIIDQQLVAIRSVASTRSGRFLAVGLVDGTISVYEANTRQLLWSKKMHSGFISGLAFTPDETMLVASSGDRTISVWKIKTGKTVYSPICAPAPLGGKPGVLTSVAVSSSGQVMAAASQTKNIDLWELSTGQHLRQLNGHTGNVWSVVFSLDGHLLVSGSYDKTVRLWDTQSGKEVRKLVGFEKDILSIAISPSGKIIATSSMEPKVRIWEADTGKRLANLENGNVLVRELAFSPDQKFLAGASENGTINIWAVGDLI